MRDFTYNNADFLKDGKPFKILSGAMHYFRIHEEYWHDRLLKLKACGLNTVETYTCWNLHEKEEGVFDFSGMLDIERFIQTANDVGLLVIVRPGPYICAEWDNGGLPYWLLTNGCRLRCDDPLYLSKVEAYFEMLLPKIKKHLYNTGGNVIAVQVENEYGSYGNDHVYIKKVSEMYKNHGLDCMYFTSDGPSDIMLNAGIADGCLATVNFYSDVKGSFEKLKSFRPDQPMMCAEFWDGWFDHWGDARHSRSTEDTVNHIDEILSHGASFNLYMFHGGTNFGFNNGANYDPDEKGVRNYCPTVTSYDYDAPLTEWGDLTEKYFAIKDTIEKHFGKTEEIPVQNTEKHAYGKVKLEYYSYLFDNLPYPKESPVPLTMEETGQGFGYIMYSTILNGPIPGEELIIEGLHDRAHIFIDGDLQSVYSRMDEYEPVKINVAAGEQKRLDILVENLGRINYSYNSFDKKGITRGVRLSGQYLFGWKIYNIPLDNPGDLNYNQASTAVPAFFKGSFTADIKRDTFIDTKGFKKGAVFINGFNLGRYWEKGPQKTLYIPAPLLKDVNELMIFETDGYTDCSVFLTDTPDLG